MQHVLYNQNYLKHPHDGKQIFQWGSQRTLTLIQQTTFHVWLPVDEEHAEIIRQGGVIIFCLLKWVQPSLISNFFVSGIYDNSYKGAFIF